MIHKKLEIKFLFLCALLILIPSLSAAAKTWRNLAPGIEYRDMGTSLLTPWSHIHVFRIDLEKNQMDLILASQLKRKHASIEEFSDYSNALITLNGGFFDRNNHPLGLRISQNKIKNPVKPISWWGVFYIENNQAHLRSHRQFKMNKHIQFAVQSGPRLIIDEKIPSLKPGLAERSALCICEDKRIIVLVTDRSPMNTRSLANLMKAPPLNCTNALNLDGGSSSQLKSNLDALKLNVHGFSEVSDAIVIKSRNP